MRPPIKPANWIFNSINITVYSTGQRFKDGLSWIYRFVGSVYRTGNGIISAWISCTRSWKGPKLFAAKCTKKVLGQKPNYAIDYENLGTGEFLKFHHQNTIFIPIKS